MQPNQISALNANCQPFKDSCINGDQSITTNQNASSSHLCNQSRSVVWTLTASHSCINRDKSITTNQNASSIHSCNQSRYLIWTLTLLSCINRDQSITTNQNASSSHSCNQSRSVVWTLTTNHSCISRVRLSERFEQAITHWCNQSRSVVNTLWTTNHSCDQWRSQSERVNQPVMQTIEISGQHALNNQPFMQPIEITIRTLQAVIHAINGDYSQNASTSHSCNQSRTGGIQNASTSLSCHQSIEINSHQYSPQTNRAKELSFSRHSNSLGRLTLKHATGSPVFSCETCGSSGSKLGLHQSSRPSRGVPAMKARLSRVRGTRLEINCALTVPQRGT